MSKPTPAKGSRLTPLHRTDDEFGPNDQRYEVWTCLCVCGKERDVRRIRLVRGNTKSCGCLRRELAQARVKKARQAYSEQCRQRREQHAATQ